MAWRYLHFGMSMPTCRDRGKKLVYYDRTVSTALVQELGPDGAFNFLAHFSRTRHLADLQLRSYPAKPTCRATLYYGLTKVIDVYERNGQFWLKGSKHAAWDESWSQKRPADDWRSPELKQAVDSYLRAAMGAVADRFSHEGAIQAMLCTRAPELFSVVDREAVVGFDNKAERERVYSSIQRELHAAFPPNPALKWWKPKTFGGELDILAIDSNGRLLTVEVKPASATDGVTWAPLQATFYARLFEQWAHEHGDSAATAIQSMLNQRIDLKLASSPPRRLRIPLEVVPIVAIGGQPSDEALSRMQQVQAALRSAGVGRSDLEIWSVEERVDKHRLQIG